MKHELNLSEVKVVLTNILVEFDKLCEKYNLRYSLAYGTMLGAARHQGFIPWDDDIDVLMPYDDYLKFLALEEVSPGQGNRYSVIHAGNEDLYGIEYFYPYAKLIDNNTEAIYIRTRDKIGAYIDIFPMTSIPKDVKEYDNFIQSKIGLEDKCYLAIRRDGDGHRNIISALKEFRRLYYYKRYSVWRNKLMDVAFSKKYESDLIGNVVWGRNNMVAPSPISYFDDLIDMTFENRTFKCFRYYDKTLTQCYGDWRKLPPVEQQVPHHEYKLYMK